MIEVRHRALLICNGGGCGCPISRPSTLSCRHCHRALYAPSNATDTAVDAFAAAKLRLRLGGLPDINEALAPKAKWRQRRTDHRLRDQIRALEAAVGRRHFRKPLDTRIFAYQVSQTRANRKPEPNKEEPRGTRLSIREIAVRHSGGLPRQKFAGPRCWPEQPRSGGAQSLHATAPLGQVSHKRSARGRRGARLFALTSRRSWLPSAIPSGGAETRRPTSAAPNEERPDPPGISRIYRGRPQQ